MNSTATTPGSVEATTALLEAELPRLEEHQQSLEKELAVVTERLESVRAALSALKALSLAPQMQQPAADTEPQAKPAPSASTEAELVTGPKADALNEQNLAGTSSDDAPKQSAEESSVSVPASARRKARKTPAGAKRQGSTGAAKAQKRRPAQKAAAQPKSMKTKPTKKAASAALAKDSGGLTEQIVAVLAKSGQSAVRARDVAQALGRDETTSSINAVRSTLDRLVATSRAHRAGRGLYQAPAN
ncbi:hypothetical protein [Streptomyces flavidovirens]